jgi:ribosomal protein L20A (L18A)
MEPREPPLTELRGTHSSTVPAAAYLEMGSRLRVKRSFLENRSQS